MIELKTGYLIEHASELPEFDEDELFQDLETTSLDDELDALNPWQHCHVLGIAIIVSGKAYYVPVRHRDWNNIPIDDVIEWQCRVMSRAKRWVNHNVKYDALVMANDLGVTCDGELFDTVTHAKIIDSDRQFKGGYGLDALSLHWLGEDISACENEIKRWIGKSKDFGACPPVPMGTYACQDVITNRRLYRYIQQRRPAECDQVAMVETELTKVLFEMERVGMTVDPIELKTREVETIARMLEIDIELSNLLGRTINPNSSDDVFDVLCNQYGMPVLHWTEEDDDGNPAGNPSFDKHAMKKYLTHPYAPVKIVELIAEYRQLSTHRSLFLEKYQ
jgi:DNA polymerase-1